MTSKPIRASTRTKASAIPAPTTRTTRRTAKAITSDPEPTPVAPAPKKSTRKPTIVKDTVQNASAPPSKGKAKATTSRKTKQAESTEREAIMAYLRIRPRIGEEYQAASPYLTPLSDTTVNMSNPLDPQDSRTKYRFSSVPPASIYTFSHVFPPKTNQVDFFKKTTLPLVQDVLEGQNGLLFTYGVTNSGKTYTVQGGKEAGTAGILPRSLDVIFNSIEGLQGDGRYRPVRLYGIDLAEDADFAPPIAPEPALAEVLGPLESLAEPNFDIEPTSVKVDRNYEYNIWISYAEVYNEKVYDLLASVKDDSGIRTDTRKAGGAKSLLLTRQALPLRPSPPSDNVDSDTPGKYIAGLRQFRVQSAEDAKALIKLGQLHRRVFGTLANRESSRSHGMVCIKIVRGHKGERDDPTSLQISRLTLVDLAGSERTKHTHTTGDRLKEAGNINKSLMVLGQCLEVMRSNQRRVAMSLSQETKDGRMDTRDVKKGLAIVPFRHSKLTEALMDYFVGDGRTVIIVNVNPYDTGYDENSHVMKFAALAREVFITPAPAPVQRVPIVGPGKTQGNKIKQLGPLTLKDPEIAPYPYSRKVHISVGGPQTGKAVKQAVLEVREEDEPPQDEDEDDHDEDFPINPLVDALFDEVENLRLQLFEAEMRSALVEAETREEVMREMEERMRKMEEMYSRRLRSEWEQHELKTDAKIDMLHQSGLFGSPVKGGKRPVIEDDISEEEDVEMSLIESGEPDSEDEEMLTDASDDGFIPSNSPLAHKARFPPRKSSIPPQAIIEKRPSIPNPLPLPSDNEDASETETEGEDIVSAAPSGTTASELANDEGSEVTDDFEEDGEYAELTSEGEEWEDPPAAKTPKAKKKVIVSPSLSSSPSPQPKRRATKSQSKATPKTSRVSRLAQDMDDLRINRDDVANSMFVPRKKALRRSESSVDDDDSQDEDGAFELPVVKKKRQLGKRFIANEDEINKMAYATEKKAARTGEIKRQGK
ncbi:P-loop containing nucleoside triphosphate hydrolase protein [Crepidotus variabilis]|uniref:Kinesin-like protein n=1 Tax=Crepidotus variabilis TaxID=179855 RepID=A0A9P6EV49_9AGAR|nr:P-loop containing nucleoside triphosphate hydrolase protein [Crepidotus variabilis]